jgi:type IV pilus assembly protein PilB
MSETPQQSEPDLHAIFGLDEQAPTVLQSPREQAPNVELSDERPRRLLAEVETPQVELSGRSAEHTLPDADLESEPVTPLSPARAPEQSAARRGVTEPSRRGSSSRFITDVIIEMGLAPRRVVEEAVETSRTSGARPERVLLESGALNSDGLARALAERYGLDHLDLNVFATDMGAANLVTTTAAKRYQAVPVAFVDKRTLLVAMADPSNVLAVDDIAIMTGYDVRVAVAATEDITGLISRLDRLEEVVAGESSGIEDLDEEQAEVVDLHETADDAPVIKLVNQVVAQAVEQHASDVHLTPDGRELRVRFRVDGVLQDVTTVTRRLAPGVISRVKIMADLDIAEKRLPQDGRVGLTVDGRHVDLPMARS